MRLRTLRAKQRTGEEITPSEEDELVAHDRQDPEEKVKECVRGARQLATDEGADEDQVVIEALTSELKQTYATLNRITHENKTNVKKKEYYKKKIRAYKEGNKMHHPTSSSSV